MRVFNENDLSSVLKEQEHRLIQKINKYSNDEIMANNIELLSENCFEEFKVEPIIIGEEELKKRSIEQHKERRKANPSFHNSNRIEYTEVDEIIAKFYYPYSGDNTLFECRASAYTSSEYPNLDLSDAYVVFTMHKELQTFKLLEDEDIMLAELHEWYQSIVTGIGYVNIDVEEFNASLKSVAVKKLMERRTVVEKISSIAKNLEVPLQKSDFAKKHIPMSRKIIPTSKKYNNEPSYYIMDLEYQYILETIKHNGSTYERTPSSYKSMQEEDLRNTLLAALNGMYQGSANGETFRNKGKTDICIEKDNRAAFVAECKIWTGKASIQDAIKQLDGYLTWRDCKTALIYFTRNKDFFKVLDTAKQTLTNFPTIRHVKEIDKNEFECSYISETNVGQVVLMRVILFNLYVQ